MYIQCKQPKGDKSEGYSTLYPPNHTPNKYLSNINQFHSHLVFAAVLSLSPSLSLVLTFEVCATTGLDLVPIISVCTPDEVVSLAS